MTFPSHSPFRPDQQQLAEKLVASLSHDQATWFSGYLAGLQSAGAFGGGALGASMTGSPVGSSGEKPKLTVLFGSESGNAEALADQTKKRAEQHGFKARVVNMADIQPAELSGLDNLLVIVSTWGDGDPPESAVDFCGALMTDEAPSMEGVRFSVCALGDTSYEKFCQTGKDVDARFEALGAERIRPREDCDVDYDDAWERWVSESLEAFPIEKPTVTLEMPLPGTPELTGEYTKKNPFGAEVLEKIVLSGTGSEKEVLHVELSLEGSGLTYEPGDAIGVFPRNREADVAAVVKAAGLSADDTLNGSTLGEALLKDYDITTLSPTLVEKYHQVVGNKELKKWLDEADRSTLKAWIHGRQFVDLIEEFAFTDWTPELLTGLLRKLEPRLYSIASSPRAHEGEVHMTVAAVRYQSHGRERAGVASCFLADAVGVGDQVPVYLHRNGNFRLPQDGDTPIIMVGPGTGIAPFRAFVEERKALGARGDNWLFFGDQRYTYDFLYQLEWQEHLADGALKKLSVAFSRDQKQKIYVQHRMKEEGAELFAWLEKGASFYVCGDAVRMAKDVHEALIEVVAEHGGKSREEAEVYVDDLRRAKRYQRDVY